MKLIKAVDIAKSCGLITIKEAFANIDIHATMIFSYKEMEGELQELYVEVDNLYKEMNKSIDDEITIEEYEKHIGGIK